MTKAKQMLSVISMRTVTPRHNWGDTENQTAPPEWYGLFSKQHLDKLMEEFFSIAMVLLLLINKSSISSAIDRLISMVLLEKYFIANN